MMKVEEANGGRQVDHAEMFEILCDGEPGTVTLTLSGMTERELDQFTAYASDRGVVIEAGTDDQDRTHIREHRHEWGEVEVSTFAGTPHRKCSGCRDITLDLDES